MIEVVETWRVIVGYDGSYEISSKGRIKSFIYRWSKDENGFIMKPVKRDKDIENSYLIINLKDVLSGKSTSQYIHRLVAESFIENPENKTQVNHIDGVKSNNTVSNLEWTTSKENHHHARYVLGKGVGETHPSCKFSKETILKVREMFESGEYTQRQIGDALDMSYPYVNNIIKRKNWGNI